jgi:putative transposase
MDEKKERNLRRKAIRLILKGLKPSAIVQRIGRSRTWLFKWRTRFDQLGWEGLKSQSRCPHQIACCYLQRTRRLVIRVRQRLVRRKVGLVGPRAIQDELRRARLLRRLPSLSTIRRILHEGGLIKAPRAPRTVYYPQPTPAADYVLHACDWAARFLTGGCKVFAFHTLDLETHALHQTIGADKSLAIVAQHALETWYVLGLPDGLQMDNDAAFCGGYKAPRRFGQFVRLCLYLGIEPIFIPPREPKRNAVIERLNGLWSQGFWKRRHFSSLAAVEQASPTFEQWYGEYYQPPALDGTTPAQAHRRVERQPLGLRQVRAVPAELPITAGRIHFIRQVDEEGFVSLLNEEWKVDRRLAGQYVWATVMTHEQRLRIYHRRSGEVPVRLVKTFHYRIPESVAPLLPEFQRPHRRRNMFTML